MVEVNNWLSEEDFAIHWHGLSLKDGNDKDCVVGLTQSQFGLVKASFVNSDWGTMKLELFGKNDSSLLDRFPTLTIVTRYHAHSEVQGSDRLYGPLVVRSTTGN